MHTIRAGYQIYFTGNVPDGRQVLLGWVSDFIGVLFFDNTGKLVESREYPLGIDLSRGLGPAVEAVVAKKIRIVKRILGFRRGPIRVQPFCLEGWRVVLKPFPAYLEDFLAHPERFTEEDARVCRRDLHNWKADQRCVLEWDKDYFLNKDGYSE
jgi:hypothetical protein